MTNRSAGHADPTQSREGRYSTARLVFYVSAASCTSATGKARRIVKSLNPTFRPFATQTPIFLRLSHVKKMMRTSITRAFYGNPRAHSHPVGTSSSRLSKVTVTFYLPHSYASARGNLY